ncbi:hypothetical protein SABIM44S_00360 [Streptomyces abikoensis]
MPDHTATEEDAPAPELPVTLDIPGKVADFLRATDPEPDERAALDEGATVRRSQGYTLRVSAVPAVHRQLLDRRQPLAVPGFTVEQHRGRLRELHEKIETEGPFIAHSSRTLIEARKPEHG